LIKKKKKDLLDQVNLITQDKSTLIDSHLTVLNQEIIFFSTLSQMRHSHLKFQQIMTTLQRSIELTPQVEDDVEFRPSNGFLNSINTNGQIKKSALCLLHTNIQFPSICFFNKPAFFVIITKDIDGELRTNGRDDFSVKFNGHIAKQDYKILYCGNGNIYTFF